MGTHETEPTYEVVWPLAALAGAGDALANERVVDLNDRTVAELLDMSQLETFYPQLREELMRRFPRVKIIPFETFGLTHGPNEHEVIAALPGKLKEHGVDIALSSLGA